MRALAASFGLSAFLAASVCLAGNEDSFLFGDQASMTGGAVTSSIRDTAAIWYNPAGLGNNRRGRLELSGTAFTLRYRQIDNGLVLDLPDERVNRSIRSRELYVVPTLLVAAREVSDGVSVGLGLFVTEQDLFDFETTVQTTDSRIDLDLAGALSGTLIRYEAGPGVGWQVTPRLRLGASLFAVYENYHEFRKLFADATMTGTYESTFFQRLVDAKSTRIGSELVLGAQYDAGDGWEFGIAVRSPRWVFFERAETDNSTALISQSPTAPAVAFSSVDHTPIGAEGTGLTRPPRIHAGASKRLGPVELSAELEVRPKAFGGPLAERSVVNGRSGLLWYAGRNTLLGIGVFSDRSGAARPAVFPDSRVDYYGLSTGWKQKNLVRLHDGEQASTLSFTTTIAVRYALGLGQSTRIRFDFRDTPDTGVVGRVDDERVGVVYHELSLYLGTGFEF